jgi:hypothetical protein
MTTSDIFSSLPDKHHSCIAPTEIEALERQAHQALESTQSERGVETMIHSAEKAFIELHPISAVLLLVLMAMSCTKEIRYHIKPASDAKKLGWRYYESGPKKGRKYMVQNNKGELTIESHSKVPRESVVFYLNDSVGKGRIRVLTTDTYQVKYQKYACLEGEQ